MSSHISFHPQCFAIDEILCEWKMGTTRLAPLDVSLIFHFFNDFVRTYIASIGGIFVVQYVINYILVGVHILHDHLFHAYSRCSYGLLLPTYLQNTMCVHLVFNLWTQRGLNVLRIDIKISRTQRHQILYFQVILVWSGAVMAIIVKIARWNSVRRHWSALPLTLDVESLNYGAPSGTDCILLLLHQEPLLHLLICSC